MELVTSSGELPGLNAVIRGVGKAGISNYNMRFLGFRNRFAGSVHDRTMKLDRDMLSGILTQGGHGDMMAVRGSDIAPVPLEEVAGHKNLVPPDHPLIESAKLVGTCFGD